LVPQYDAIVQVEATDFFFLAFHGILMIVIVIPWSCVAITSMFCFFLLVEAHKADVDSYQKAVIGYFSRGHRSSWMIALQLAGPLHARLSLSTPHFDHLFASFVVIFYMLFLSSVQDINWMITGKVSVDFSKILQDILYLFLGLASLFCGLWSASSLNRYWNHVVMGLNSLPKSLPKGFQVQDLPIHSSMIHILQGANHSYNVYGIPLTQSTVWSLTKLYCELSLVMILILNYPS